ncbi:MAG TPA: flagellar basal-body MS-ring/collar protein FliF [bacterium]|nr:flagellar basal-body MS-ring/collar protein FliF [bacterium]
MNAYLQKLRQQFMAMWGALSAKQKAMYLLVMLGFVVGLGGIIAWSSRPQYEPLWANLSAEDAGKIKKELDAQGITYKLEGNQILVPQQQVAALRMDLTTNGAAPRNGLPGFESLSSFNPMQTQDDKERAYNLALGGEIARSLKTLEGVTDATVILTIPKERIYQEEQQPVKAAVNLTLNSELKEAQVQSIVKFVSASVPGLKPEFVEVTDQHAISLTPEAEDPTNLAGVKEKQLALERAIVKGYESGLKGALASMFGADKVTVRVNVLMDFDRVAKEITNLTKPGFDQLLESQQTMTEKFTGMGFRPGGTAGVESNIPGYEATQNQPVNYEKNEVRTNYLHNTEHTTREQSPYVKRLTAMVNVDGTYTLKRDEQGNVIERTYVPRTPEELAALEQTVKAAIGYDATRGDVISVTNITVDRTEQVAAEDAARRKELEQKRVTMLVFAGLVVGILLILLLVELKTYLGLRDQKALRERELAMRSATSTISEKGMVTELTIEEKEKMELRRRAEKAAHDQPEMVANLIRTWMAEEER